MLKKAGSQSSNGQKGACMVMRYQPKTTVICEELTKAACDLVDTQLGDNGHARFLGTGTRCLS